MSLYTRFLEWRLRKARERIFHGSVRLVELGAVSSFTVVQNAGMFDIRYDVTPEYEGEIDSVVTI